MSSEAERYAKLGLADALRRPYDYSSACVELSFLLRRAYSKLPKSLQSVLFQDTLHAFRLLPEQAVAGISAANLLNQAVEASLPKQKKALAVSEYKHAVIAQKRRCKLHHNLKGVAALPHDVLVLIFSFLDLRSLLTVGFVCKTWKSAANDDMLWKIQYSVYFGKSEVHIETETQHEIRKMLSVYQNKENTSLPVSHAWKESFRSKHIGSSRRLLSSRVYCKNCKSVIWRSSITSKSCHSCFLVSKHPIKIKQMTPSKVAEYLLEEAATLSESSSDSESDSDDIWPYKDRISKLWALPKDIGSRQ